MSLLRAVPVIVSLWGVPLQTTPVLQLMTCASATPEPSTSASAMVKNRTIVLLLIFLSLSLSSPPSTRISIQDSTSADQEATAGHEQDACAWRQQQYAAGAATVGTTTGIR
jgi:hypothetical protein